MDRQKIVNSLLGAVFKKGQEELSSLLGQPLEFGGVRVESSDRQALFENLQDQLVVAELQVEGDREGTAFLLLELSTALTLGGTLIMLPEEELQARIEKNEFGADEADAFGETVNLLAGVLTSLFDEIFPDKLRFIKGGQTVVNPLKVVAKEDYPCPDEALWLAASTVSLQGRTLDGEARVVIPAGLLGLGDEPKAPAGGTADSSSGEASGTAQDDAQEDNGSATADAEPTADPGAAAEPQATAADGVGGTDAADGVPPDAPVSTAEASSSGGDPSVSEEKLVKILKLVHAKIREEVGGFLGHAFDIRDETFACTSREEAFSGLDGSQVLARMKIEGDREGEACLLTCLGAAIHLGGTLIMLPDSELQQRLQSGEYGAEDSDAFGEVVNIVAGIYTSVFNDIYPGNLRFVKTEQQTFDPLVVTAKDEYPVEDLEYYRASGEAWLDEQSLGPFTVLIPTGIVGLKKAEETDDGQHASDQSDTEPGGAEAPPAAAAADSGSKPAAGSGEMPGEPAGETAAGDGGEPRPVAMENTSQAKPAILVCGDSEEQAETFIKAIEALDCEARFQHVQEPLGGFGPEMRGVFLVLGDVGEQGIAAAIKINTSVGGRMPLIAAGPNWTRSMVLRAIKYGIRDILVTPASEEQIQEKVRLNLVA